MVCVRCVYRVNLLVYIWPFFKKLPNIWASFVKNIVAQTFEIAEFGHTVCLRGQIKEKEEKIVTERC